MRASRATWIRRSLPAGVSAVVLLGMAAAPPAAAGPVFAIRFQGQVASAVWSTCEAEPKAGDRCEETVVMAFDARTQETTDQATGPHFLRDRRDVVVLQRFWSEARWIDGELLLVPLKESFGRTTTADVRIPQRLTSASAAASSIQMHTTDYVQDRDYTETDSVRVSWAPNGRLVPIREWGRSSQRWGLQVESTKGWARHATAAGTIDGKRVAGQLVSADLFSLTQRSQLVLRGKNAR